MVKKMQAQSEKQVIESTLEFSRLIWLAGLGALVKCKDEGNQVFKNLVEEGERFQESTMKLADDKVEGVRDQLEKVKDQAIDTWDNTWDKLGGAIEERVALVLNRLGVPTKKDIEELSRRVEVLNESVKELTKA